MKENKDNSYKPTIKSTHPHTIKEARQIQQRK